jgi:hypothetical protein
MRKFSRKYTISIEADTEIQPVGWGTKKHEVMHLQSAARSFAADVQLFYQTKFLNAKIAVEVEP